MKLILSYEALLAERGGGGVHVPCLNFRSGYVGISQGSYVACRNLPVTMPQLSEKEWVLERMGGGEGE